MKPSWPGLAGAIWGFAWCFLFARLALFGVGLDPNDELADWPYQLYSGIAFIYLAAVPASLLSFPRRMEVQVFLGAAALGAGIIPAGSPEFGIVFLIAVVPASGLLLAPLIWDWALRR